MKLMKINSIPLSKLPKFLNYLFIYIKEHGEYNLSKKFIASNFSLIGYCQCEKKYGKDADFINNCSTVYLKSKSSIKKYKINSICTLKNVGVFEYLHIKENKPIEYEYLSSGVNCESIYKNEVQNAIDDLHHKKSIVFKKKRYKDK